MEAGGGQRGAGLGEKKTDSTIEYLNLFAGFLLYLALFYFWKILQSIGVTCIPWYLKPTTSLSPIVAIWVMTSDCSWNWLHQWPASFHDIWRDFDAFLGGLKYNSALSLFICTLIYLILCLNTKMCITFCLFDLHYETSHSISMGNVDAVELIRGFIGSWRKWTSKIFFCQYKMLS